MPSSQPLGTMDNFAKGIPIAERSQKVALRSQTQGLGILNSPHPGWVPDLSGFDAVTKSSTPEGCWTIRNTLGCIRFQTP